MTLTLGLFLLLGACGVAAGLSFPLWHHKIWRQKNPDDTEPPTQHRILYRVLGLGFVVALPATAMLLYSALGSPHIAALPYETRMQELLHLTPTRVEQLETRVQGLEQSLQKHPDDFRALISLAQAYQNLGRYGKARRLWKQARPLGTFTTEEWSQFGESLLHTTQGRISPEAHNAFLQSVRQNRNNPRARWFLGLEAVQQGNMKRGLAIWRDLARDSKSDAPWWQMLQQHMQDVAAQENIDLRDVTPRHPLEPQEAANPLAAFSAEEKIQIRGMVNRLKDKLAATPDDAAGWQQLGRSLTVMGNLAEAVQAYEKSALLRPDDPRAQLNYALAIVTHRDEDPAVPLPKRFHDIAAWFTKHDPNSPGALFIRSISAEAHGQRDKAHTLLKALTKVVPPQSDAGQALQRWKQRLSPTNE